MNPGDQAVVLLLRLILDTRRWRARQAYMATRRAPAAPVSTMVEGRPRPGSRCTPMARPTARQ